MENESGESGSLGGAGSDTSMFTSTAVRPLSRCGERGIWRSCDAKCGRGRGTAHRRERGYARATWPRAHRPDRASRSGFNQRQLADTSFCGTNTWKNRWARPSLLTKVPSDSAKVPAGRTRSAFAGSRILEMIERDHVRGGVEEGVDLSGGSTAVKIVLQDDHGIRRALPDRLERGAERASTDKRRAH